MKIPQNTTVPRSEVDRNYPLILKKSDKIPTGPKKRDLQPNRPIGLYKYNFRDVFKETILCCRGRISTVERKLTHGIHEPIRDK